MSENDKRAEALREWLDGREFYELCQTYRHSHNQLAATTNYGDLKRAILAKVEELDKGPIVVNEHPDFITAYESVSGWNAVHMTWNPEYGGFYEPWTTGCGPYTSKEMAISEAQSWARNEGVDFKEPVVRNNEDVEGSGQSS